MRLAALLGSPLSVQAADPATPGVRLAAAWQAGRDNRVGVLVVERPNRVSIAVDLSVPTRAHGLLREPGGDLLAVARRPGDWLLRWNAQGRALIWRWIEPGRAFAGHLLASPDGRWIYTTELDLETGCGLVGVREAISLAKLDEWPSHGVDPHEMLWDAMQPGAIMLANGGVPTRPETGRLKQDLEHMDSSLVRLDGRSGALLNQWRLDDKRLSLRHLAWNGDRLGIALQAEHAELSLRRAAPVLAVLENGQLNSYASPAMAGYGGSIVNHHDGFAVACPRQQGLALFDRHGYLDFIALQEACPLANQAGQLWAGGRIQALGLSTQSFALQLPDIRLDNHWLAL